MCGPRLVTPTHKSSPALSVNVGPETVYLAQFNQFLMVCVAVTDVTLVLLKVQKTGIKIGA